MKFIAIMGHEETRPQVRALFQKYQVHLFSNLSIKGCSCEQKGGEQPTWWPSNEMPTSYTSLCFAILEDEKAEALMTELEKNPIAIEKDFPARAFLMNVERTA
uniref:Uncharacterized protein n=1 Tax=Chlorobium chlorochromatii (strain CaD3) TaxID=340177 RepID=Q3AUC3_CHLCH